MTSERCRLPLSCRPGPWWGRLSSASTSSCKAGDARRASIRASACRCRSRDAAPTNSSEPSGCGADCEPLAVATATGGSTVHDVAIGRRNCFRRSPVRLASSASAASRSSSQVAIRCLRGQQLPPALVDRRIGIEWPFGPIDAGQHGLQGVVVGLRDRIELVIVAAGAMDRRAGEGRHEVGDHVVAIEHLGQLLVDRVVDDAHQRAFVPRARRQKTQATIACGSSGNSTSPATCSSIKRA